MPFSSLVHIQKKIEERIKKKTPHNLIKISENEKKKNLLLCPDFYLFSSGYTHTLYNAHALYMPIFTPFSPK